MLQEPKHPQHEDGTLLLQSTLHVICWQKYGTFADARFEKTKGATIRVLWYLNLYTHMRSSRPRLPHIKVLHLDLEHCAREDGPLQH